MKKVIVLTMLLIIEINSFGQQPNPMPPFTKQDYLAKSKHQKTVAWILLGGGAAVTTVGFILISHQYVIGPENNNGGGVVALVGSAAMLVSIPFFIASGKNKRRGMAVSTSIDMEDESIVQHARVVRQSCPALSFKINLK